MKMRHPTPRTGHTLTWIMMLGIHGSFLFLMSDCSVGEDDWGGSGGPTGFVERFCLDCHDSGVAEGGVTLEAGPIDWTDKQTAAQWETVHQLVSKRIMPPSDYEQPSDSERGAMLNWLDGELRERLPIGGTGLRRLSRRELQNTIRSAFRLPNFELPQGFPQDPSTDGFDNVAASLVLAPSHLEAFAATASSVADEFFPPPAVPVLAKEFDIPSDDLVISYSSACRIDDVMRLASGGANLIRHATWPTKFEAPAHGRYTIRLTVSTFRPAVNTTPILQVERIT
ncbi:MAG: DUF1587 domain-containing protein, partial [Planctomycetota bacterium]